MIAIDEKPTFVIVNIMRSQFLDMIEVKMLSFKKIKKNKKNRHNTEGKNVASNNFHFFFSHRKFQFKNSRVFDSDSTRFQLIRKTTGFLKL